MHHQPPLRRQHRAAQIAQVPGAFVRQSVTLFQVSLQKRLPLETFQANRARVPVSLLPVVSRFRRQNASVLRSQVIGQVLLVRIGLVAMIASIQLLSRVAVHVVQVFGSEDEALPAAFASERVVLGVPSTVALEIRLLVRSVVAQVAGESLRAGVNQLVPRYVHGTSERLAALVAAERSVDAVQILQVFNQLPRVAETGAALHALVNRS